MRMAVEQRWVDGQTKRAAPVSDAGLLQVWAQSIRFTPSNDSPVAQDLYISPQLWLLREEDPAVGVPIQEIIEVSVDLHWLAASSRRSLNIR